MFWYTILILIGVFGLGFWMGYSFSTNTMMDQVKGISVVADKDTNEIGSITYYYDEKLLMEYEQQIRSQQNDQE
jgi:hypothetical protein